MKNQAAQHLIVLSCPDPDIDSSMGDFEFPKEVCCSECHSVRSSWYPRPIGDRIRNEQEPTCTQSPTFSGGCRVFRRDFIELVQPWLPGLVLGAVEFASGRTSKRYVTAYSPAAEELVVYKYDLSHAGIARQCRVCHARLSASWGGSGEAFAMRGHIGTRSAAQVATGGQLCVTEDLLDQLPLIDFPDLVFEPIDLLDAWPPGWPEEAKLGLD